MEAVKESFAGELPHQVHAVDREGHGYMFNTYDPAIPPKLANGLGFRV